MHILSPDPADLRFPPLALASADGLLAIGGDLRPERLLAAYRNGIFPWFSDGQPILWWSPDPRAVLFPSRLRISRSLRKTLTRGELRVTLDTCFRDVIGACAEPRVQYPDGGTWITLAMQDAYAALHERGFAHSVETWRGAELVGGLYGIALGGAFFGESMFSRADDASKVALVWLVRQLQTWGFSLIDCQLPSRHLFTLGAEEIDRDDFIGRLNSALVVADRPGPWRFDPDLSPGLSPLSPLSPE